MRKHLKGTAIAAVLSIGLLSTMLPAHAYKVIARKIEVNGIPIEASAASVMFTIPQPMAIPKPVVMTTAAGPMVAGFALVSNGEDLMPVQVTIRERHRHRILGLVARHHWRTRTETRWVPVSSITSGKGTPLLVALLPQ